MAVFRKIASSLLFMSLSGFNHLNAKEVILSPVDQAPELRHSEGYVLIDLDARGTAPSIEFVRLGKVGSDYPENMASRKLSSNTFNLKATEKGFYIGKLKSGVYQITQVNAPYFGLPYALSTSELKTWRFTIEKDRINYIGTLVIEGSRSKENIETHFLNSFAQQYESIISSTKYLQSEFPLTMGTSYRDDFYSEYMKLQGKTND